MRMSNHPFACLRVFWSISDRLWRLNMGSSSQNNVILGCAYSRAQDKGCLRLPGFAPLRGTAPGPDMSSPPGRIINKLFNDRFLYWFFPCLLDAYFWGCSVAKEKIYAGWKGFARCDAGVYYMAVDVVDGDAGGSCKCKCVVMQDIIRGVYEVSVMNGGKLHLM